MYIRNRAVSPASPKVTMSQDVLARVGQSAYVGTWPGDDMRIARRLYRKPVVEGVYRLEEGRGWMTVCLPCRRWA